MRSQVFEWGLSTECLHSTTHEGWQCFRPKMRAKPSGQIVQVVDLALSPLRNGAAGLPFAKPLSADVEELSHLGPIQTKKRLNSLKFCAVPEITLLLGKPVQACSRDIGNRVSGQTVPLGAVVRCHRRDFDRCGRFGGHSLADPQ